MQIIFENVSVDEKSTENIISKINATKDCSNSKDSTALNQDLKNHELEEFIKVSIANGVIKMNTFKITYLNE